jgi:hypothetical protein
VTARLELQYVFRYVDPDGSGIAAVSLRFRKLETVGVGTDMRAAGLMLAPKK